MAQKDGEIAALYLELAFACFDKAADAPDPVAADVLKKMAQRYAAHAMELNPSLGAAGPPAELKRREPRSSAMTLD